MRDVGYTHNILGEKSDEMEPLARLLHRLVEYSNKKKLRGLSP
jgi:hypothetical protein